MIYLNCPFEEKDECKKFGGKWDPKKKQWYIPEGVAPENFSKWIISDSNASPNQEKVTFEKK